MIETLCGIDEAGRGPIAGPLVVAGVVLHRDIDGLNDSKKLSASKRDKLYQTILDSSTHHTVTIDSIDIDQNGLSHSIKSALIEIKESLSASSYLFDGNSSFGVDGISTLIKADSKIAEVSAASIIAKVQRDKIMAKLSLKYPQYELHKHKGYITKKHIELIKEHGLSPIHRKSYKVKALSQEPTLF